MTLATPQVTPPPPSHARSPVRGSIDAVFGVRGEHPTLAYTSAPPLELRGPFHDDGTPARAPRYFLRNVTAGVFGGDRYRIRVRAEPGARVRVQPTSAARVHESRAETAHLTTSIEVAPGAELTFDAGVTILQQGSRLEQATDLVVHPGGRLRYVEIITLGRLASGERLAFRRFTQALRLHTGDGVDRYRERFELAPSEGDLLDAALGGAGVIGTLLLAGTVPSIAPALLQSEFAVFAGSSALPHGAGVIVRVLGARVEPVSRLLERVLAEVDAAT